MVVLVDEDDIGFGTTKGACGGDSGETAPDDDDSWLSQIHASSSTRP